MPIITPSGRFLGRKPDTPDQRDHLFRKVHAHLMAAPLAPRTDNIKTFPQFLPPLDQGQAGSCGPNAFARWIKQFHPEFDCSRLELYWQVRLLEGTTGEDAGVETRDLFKAAQQTGVIPETDWPYDISKLTEEPPDYPAVDRTKIISYSRLTSAMDVLACLSSGRTGVLGFEVPASFDDPEIASKGVLRYPQKAEPKIGGHDVHFVDYDLNFRKSAVFRASGVDPALMTDHALLIENSWGVWGLGGFFWIALPWVIDASTGADLWTGKA